MFLCNKLSQGKLTVSFKCSIKEYGKTWILCLPHIFCQAVEFSTHCSYTAHKFIYLAWLLASFIFLIVCSFAFISVASAYAKCLDLCIIAACFQPTDVVQSKDGCVAACQSCCVYVPAILLRNVNSTSSAACGVKICCVGREKLSFATFCKLHTKQDK